MHMWSLFQLVSISNMVNNKDTCKMQILLNPSHERTCGSDHTRVIRCFFSRSPQISFSQSPPSFSLSPSLTHTLTHTLTNSLSHTHTHTHTLTHINAHTYTHSLSPFLHLSLSSLSIYFVPPQRACKPSVTYSLRFN